MEGGCDGGLIGGYISPRRVVARSRMAMTAIQKMIARSAAERRVLSALGLRLNRAVGLAMSARSSGAR